MIYTVTFNPAVDYVVYLDRLEEGKTNRTTGEAQYFGGKGINVSLILNTLHQKSTALGFVAGYTGKAIEEGLEAQGLTTRFVHLKNGLSRINVKIKAGAETEINANGPEIPEDAVGELFDILNQLQKGDVLILAGSVPGTLPSDIYEKILESLKDRGVLTLVDACGDLLKRTLRYRPFLIKPNLDELSEIFGQELQTEEEITEHAKKLQELGAENVLVSLGKRGALLVTQKGDVLTAPALGGKPKNTVGAGDSMLAGFLAGYLKTGDFSYALLLGSAAGGATACSEGLAKEEEIFKLFNENK